MEESQAALKTIMPGTMLGTLFINFLSLSAYCPDNTFSAKEQQWCAAVGLSQPVSPQFVQWHSVVA